MRCPIWNCGGNLQLDNDEKIPDLKCDNCGPIYRCINIDEL